MLFTESSIALLSPLESNLVLPILVAGDRDCLVPDGKSTIIGVGDDQACDTREDSGRIIHSMENAENDDLVIMLLVPNSGYYLYARCRCMGFDGVSLWRVCGCCSGGGDGFSVWGKNSLRL